MIHLAAFADVRRASETETPTGKSKAMALEYEQVPCHVAAVTDSNPTTRTEAAQDALNIGAYAWFPLVWKKPETEEPIPVTIMRGDTIEVGSQTWIATADQDPDQPDPTRVRVRVHRPHGGGK